MLTKKYKHVKPACLGQIKQVTLSYEQIKMTDTDGRM